MTRWELRRRARELGRELTQHPKLWAAALEWGLGVQTRGVTQQGPCEDGHHHVPMQYYALHRMLQQLQLRRDDVVMDLGSGLGRIVLLASRYPVRKVIGVELDPELHRAAEANRARMRGRKAELELICGAAEAQAMDEVTVLTLFNPFGEATLAKVLSRLEDSMKTPRTVRIAYANPVFDHLLHDAPFLECTAQWPIDQFSGFDTGGLDRAVSFWRTLTPDIR